MESDIVERTHLDLIHKLTVVKVAAIQKTLNYLLEKICI
jgi:hypothetical protein